VINIFDVSSTVVCSSGNMLFVDGLFVDLFVLFMVKCWGSGLD